MKGLRHNVIEINDTNNDNIERILVFLKPQATDVALAATRAQATQLLQELEIKKTRRLSKKQLFAVGVIAAAVIIIAAVVLMM